MQLPIDDDEFTMVPIIWFEDKIVEPPKKMQILLKDAIDTGPNLAFSTLVICTIMASIQALLFGVYLLWSYHQTNLDI